MCVQPVQPEPAFLLHLLASAYCANAFGHVPDADQSVAIAGDAVPTLLIEADGADFVLRCGKQRCGAGDGRPQRHPPLDRRSRLLLTAASGSGGRFGRGPAGGAPGHLQVSALTKALRCYW